MAAAAAVLAHQGGWDEILFVAVPIVVVVGLLRLVKRRIERTRPHPPTEAEQPQQHDQPASS